MSGGREAYTRSRDKNDNMKYNKRSLVVTAPASGAAYCFCIFCPLQPPGRAQAVKSVAMARHHDPDKPGRNLG